MSSDYHTNTVMQEAMGASGVRTGMAINDMAYERSHGKAGAAPASRRRAERQPSPITVRINAFQDASPVWVHLSIAITGALATLYLVVTLSQLPQEGLTGWAMITGVCLFGAVMAMAIIPMTLGLLDILLRMLVGLAYLGFAALVIGGIGGALYLTAQVFI